jgi:hypothetical protein
LKKGFIPHLPSAEALKRVISYHFLGSNFLPVRKTYQFLKNAILFLSHNSTVENNNVSMKRAILSHHSSSHL